MRNPRFLPRPAGDFRTVFGLCLLILAASALPGLRGEETFHTLTSTHFTVYYESPYPPAGVLNDLEGLHAKLLLDLNDFVPWAKEGIIKVYLYQDADSYRRRMGVAQWAGGHVDLRQRTIHCYESEGFRRVMAHELAHLFFDDFFLQKNAHPPSWLTEGVATVMEWDYGLEQSRPLNDAALVDQMEPLESFFSFDYHHDQREAQEISLWYQQAYSLVRYLIRNYTALQFYLLCRNIRDGQSIDKSLSLAYGTQVWDVPALESQWRAKLKEEGALSRPATPSQSH